MDMKFYKCSHCGNIVAYVQDNGPKVVCCGEEMKEMVANATDAATEKHVPVVTVDGNQVTVSVGSVTHPMEEKHYIQWISLQTEQGNQRKALKPGQEPTVTFAMAPGEGFPFACLPDFIKKCPLPVASATCFSLSARYNKNINAIGEKSRYCYEETSCAFAFALLGCRTVCRMRKHAHPRRRRQHHNHPRGTRYRSLRRSERAHLHGNGQAPVRQRCRENHQSL